MAVSIIDQLHLKGWGRNTEAVLFPERRIGELVVCARYMIHLQPRVINQVILCLMQLNPKQGRFKWNALLAQL